MIHEICVLERARWYFYADFRHSVICLWCHVVSDCPPCFFFSLLMVGLNFRGWRNLEGESELSWSWDYLTLFSVKPFILLPARMGEIWKTTAEYVYVCKFKIFCNKLKMQICLILIQMRSWVDAFCSITLQDKWWWLSFSFQDWVHYCLHRPMVFRAV